MSIIKQLKKGNFKIIHERLSINGYEQDCFELFDIKNRVSVPFNGDIKINFRKSSDPLDMCTDYTDKEYEDMLDRQIKNYKIK